MSKYTANTYRSIDYYLREVHVVQEQRFLPEQRVDANASSEKYFARIYKQKKQFAGLHTSHCVKLQQRVQHYLEVLRQLAKSELLKFSELVHVSASQKIQISFLSETITEFAGQYDPYKEFEVWNLAFLDEPVSLPIIAKGNFGIFITARTDVSRISKIFLPTIDEVVSQFVSSNKMTNAANFFIGKQTSSLANSAAEPQLETLKQLVAKWVAEDQHAQANKLHELHPERNCWTDAFLDEPLPSITAFFNRCASSYELLSRFTSQPVIAPQSLSCPAEVRSPNFSDLEMLPLVHTAVQRYSNGAMAWLTKEQSYKEHLADLINMPFLTGKLAYPNCFSLPFLRHAQRLDLQTLIAQPDRFHEWITQAKSKAKRDYLTSVAPEHLIDFVALFLALNAGIFRTRHYFELLTEPISYLARSIERIGKQMCSVESKPALICRFTDLIQLTKAGHATTAEAPNKLMLMIPFQRQHENIEVKESVSGLDASLFTAYGLQVEPKSITKFELADEPEDTLLRDLIAKKKTNERMVEIKMTAVAQSTALSGVDPNYSIEDPDDNTSIGVDIQHILKHVSSLKRPIESSSPSFSFDNQNSRIIEIDFPVAKKPSISTPANNNQERLVHATSAAVQRVEIQDKPMKASLSCNAPPIVAAFTGPKCRVNQPDKPAVLCDARTTSGICVASALPVVSAAPVADTAQVNSTQMLTRAFSLELESISSENTSPKLDFQSDGQVIKNTECNSLPTGCNSRAKDIESADFEDDGSELLMAGLNTPPIDRDTANQQTENRFAIDDVSDREMETIRTPPTESPNRSDCDYWHRYSQAFAASNWHQRQFDFQRQSTADNRDEWPIAAHWSFTQRSDRQASIGDDYPFDTNHNKVRTPLTEINGGRHARSTQFGYTSNQATTDSLKFPIRNAPSQYSSFGYKASDCAQGEMYDSRFNWPQSSHFNAANRSATHFPSKDMATTSGIDSQAYSHGVMPQYSSLPMPSNVVFPSQVSLPSSSFHDVEMRQFNQLTQRNCASRWENFSANDFALTPLDMHRPTEGTKVQPFDTSLSLHSGTGKLREPWHDNITASGSQINETFDFNVQASRHMNSEDLYSHFVRDTAYKSIGYLRRFEDLHHASLLPTDPVCHESQGAEAPVPYAQTFLSVLESEKHDFEIQNAANRNYGIHGAKMSIWNSASASQSLNDLPYMSAEKSGPSRLLQSTFHTTGRTNSNGNVAISSGEWPKISQEVLAPISSDRNASLALLPNPNTMPELNFLKSSPPRSNQNPQYPTTSFTRPFNRLASGKRQRYTSKGPNPRSTTYVPRASRSANGAKCSRGWRLGK